MSARRSFERCDSGEKSTYDNASDDESDTITELSRESLTSSVGRSSIGSIPWAEDAIKQNQYEWEKLERMFHGEEPLPEDAKLRDEILEWQEVFPHLRITGRPMPIYESANAKLNDPFYEEIIAQDPPPVSRTRSSRSGKDCKNLKEADFLVASYELDKCLCISSGQVLRNNQNNAKGNGKYELADGSGHFLDRNDRPVKKKTISSSLLVVPPTQAFGVLIANTYVTPGSYQLPGSRNCSAQSVKQFHYNTNNSIGGSNYHMHRKLAPLAHRPQQKPGGKLLEATILSTSASATHTRIPPLAKSYKFIVRNSHVPALLSDIGDQRHTKFNVVKSATPRYSAAASPTKQIFTLPTLSAVDSMHRGHPTGTTAIPRYPGKVADFRSEVVGRSISAAVTQKNGDRVVHDFIGVPHYKL